MDEIVGFRLSPQQQRLWELLPSGAAPDVAAAALRLEGELDPEALKAAFGRIVERHEILRTTFRRIAGMDLPLQVVAAAGFSWETRDADGLGAQALLRRAAERPTPFDLENGPVLRATLHALSPRGHLLLLEVSSLCADSFSLGMLARELAAEHAGTAEAEPPLQYIDVAEWQNELLASAEGVEHWRQQNLSGIAGWRLPFDASPSAGSGEAGRGEVELALPPPDLQAAERLARDASVPPAAFFLLCWQALLARFAGLDRLVAGVVFDGRNYEDLDRTLGPLARRIPVACDLAGAPVRELLARAGRAWSEAEKWQESYAAGSAPAFYAGFSFEEQPAEIAAGGLRITLLERRAGGEPCALELCVLRTDGGARLRFRYDTARFPAGEIERLAGAYGALVASALARPEAAVEDLSLLAEAERRRLLVDFTDTAAPRGAACLHHLLAAQAARTPSASAIFADSRVLTYAELDAAANRLANHLRKQGAGPETLVAVALGRSPELLAALLGVLKAGAAYLPLDEAHPTERLAHMLEDSTARLLITGPGFRGRLPPHAADVVDLERDQPRIAAESDRDPAVAVDPEHLAYVLYTSGSTGRPKGTLVTHRGLINYLAWALEAYPVAEGSGAPVHSPLGFDLTVTSLFLPLLAGRACRLLSDEQGLGGLAAALAEGGHSFVKLTPSHLDVLAELRSRGAAARALVIGGEALIGEKLRPWREDSPDIRLFNEYGPTETVVGCCVYEQPAGPVPPGPVPIGRPIANTRLYVLDRAGQPVPVWIPGALYVGGDGVARGYLGRPDLTAERFVPDPFGAPGGRLYATGDLVRHLPQGDLDYLGRTDHQLKVRGHRIEPGEIEAALAADPAVAAAAVVAREIAPGDRRLVAYVVPRDGEPRSLSAAALRRFLEERLPAAMIPAAFVPIAALPLNSNGKVDRRALAESGPLPGADRPELEEAFAPPEGAEEELLAAAWAQVLGIERVGVDDNFFALGGDSIRTIQVRAEAEKRGLPVTTQQLFQYPTIRALARALRREAGGEEAVEPVAPFALLRQEDRLRTPAGIEDAYPLSSLQAGMVFHSEYSPESAIYHDVFSFRLRGPLDPQALRAALQRLAARHPVLRTGFDLGGFSEPLQLVHREVELPLAWEDLGHLPDEEQEAAVAAWFERERRQPFDWSRPPLLRAQVHRRSDGTFQFGVGFHHSILDGWSTATLLSELFRDYLFLAGVEGASAPASEPPAVGYRDFVAAERRALESEASRAYWTRLAGESRSRLPRWPGYGEGGQGDDLAGRIGLLFVQLAPEISVGLRRVARQAGVPLKSVLLAAHLRALAAAAGEPDVTTGVISNGRLEVEGAERVLGLFLNTLPVRVRIGGTWLDLVREVFALEREQLPHRRFPLAALQRIGDGQPLFETVFNFVHFHVYQGLSGLRGLEVLNGRSTEEVNYPFGANFSFSDADGGVHLRFDYDARQLGREQVELLAALYEGSLAALATDPASPCDSVPLPPAERLRLVLAWEGDAGGTEEVLPVHERFAARAALHPEAPAVVYAGGSLSYGELDRHADRLARRLARLGAGPETRVGVCLPRSPELIVSLLAILKAGGAYLPLDPAHPAERLAALLADAGAGLLITAEGVAPGLAPEGIPSLLLDRDRAEIEREEAAPLPVATGPAGAAYVVYTSGSTGTPKGVVVHHGGLADFSRAVVAAVGLAPGHRMLLFAPLAFDASALQIFPTLTSGAALVVHPDPAGMSSEEILRFCRDLGVTVLDLPGALWRQWVETMAEAGGPLPESISVYMTGGERLSTEALRAWGSVAPAGALLVSSYGPTEATVTTTFFTLRGAEARAAEPLPSSPLGRPLPHARLRLLDTFLEPVPPGTPGEICIGGSALARGYLGLPNLTAGRFVPDPFCGAGNAAPGERLYRTGDLARALPGGGLEFLGRVDHQVKIRGFRVEPGEVEATLARHPAVREAVVVAREDRPGERRLVGYVVAEREAPSIAELRAYVAASLPEFMVPSAFVLLAGMPLLPSGKVDRRALPAPEGGRAGLGSELVLPRTPIEQVLAEIWCQVLGVREIGVFDNFFELGGHSLLATQVITRVRQAFDYDLQLREIFDSPTIEGIAAALLADPQHRERVQRNAELRVRLAALSDDEIEALLLAEASLPEERNPR